MKNNFDNLMKGYQNFRQKYAAGDSSIMKQLSVEGQSPQIMVIACSDSRVDPSIILQCDPGDLFVVRNVANLVPPYESDHRHHGTSAALEYGICYLKVKHLVILGHSQCGGIDAHLHPDTLHQNDFISDWLTGVDKPADIKDTDSLAKNSIVQSYQNCLSFPWIKSRIDNNELDLHLWFLNIEAGELSAYDHQATQYAPLS
jgi:carbonic anhydrase